MMIFGFQAVNLCKISWKKAVKTLIFFQKAIFLLLRLHDHPVMLQGVNILGHSPQSVCSLSC